MPLPSSRKSSDPYRPEHSRVHDAVYGRSLKKDVRLPQPGKHYGIAWLDDWLDLDRQPDIRRNG